MTAVAVADDPLLDRSYSSHIQEAIQYSVSYTGKTTKAYVNEQCLFY
jgi:hypothetical protein